MRQSREFPGKRFTPTHLEEFRSAFIHHVEPLLAESSVGYGNANLTDLYESLTLRRGHERWSFDTWEEFVVEIDGDYQTATMSGSFTGFSNLPSYDITIYDMSADVSVSHSSKVGISTLMRPLLRAADTPEATIPPLAEFEMGNYEPPKPRIFIGHGGASTEWRDLYDHLRDLHQWDVEAFESGARAGHHVRDVLESMIDGASFAILVMSGEDEQADGAMRARQNVIHEAGLFQGRLGFNRVVILREDGVELFSNVDGVQYIDYPRGSIRSTYGDVLGTLRREFGAR